MLLYSIVPLSWKKFRAYALNVMVSACEFALHLRGTTSNQQFDLGTTLDSIQQSYICCHQYVGLGH